MYDNENKFTAMSKTITFYTAREISIIKDDIKNGVPMVEIGQRHAKDFNREPLNISAKAYIIKRGNKTTTKTASTKTHISTEGISIPHGLVWEGNGDIRLYKDHFRVYFK